MNYYLLIIFLISNFFLFSIFNLSTYGYEVAKVSYSNELKNIAFIPIKAKILPQYDESTPQSVTEVKSQKDSKANDINKPNNPDKSDESTPQSVTEVKSQKDSKTNDKNKSDNSEDAVVTVTAVSSDESTPQSVTEVKSQKDSMANDTNKIYNSTESVPPSMGIKILSPISGKEIPVGNLTIFGTSTDNEKSNCSVSVDLNNQKPFQKAIATGPYGSDDYSSWTFTYSPSYHTIENGLNDLTSKLECVENSKVTTKWHSINVTGDITKDANPTSSLVYNDPLGILPQLKPLSTNPSANTTGIASDETTIPPTKLSAYLVLPKDQIFHGEPQNFMVKISDPKTLQAVAGAKLDIKVVQGSVLVDEYNGTSDASGEYSWNLNSDTPSGKSDVLVSASANGYEPASITGSFQVRKQLLVQASLLKDLVVPGDNQTIDVKVMDANTKEIVSGANVMAKIGGKNISEKTDDSGVLSYSWDTPATSGGNRYDVVLNVSSHDYPKVMKTISFKMDKPQNLLEPPITNYEDKIVSVNTKDPNVNLESQNKFQECTNTLSSVTCSTGGDDKPVLNPTTDDKPVLNTKNDNKNIQNDNQKQRNGYDFLSSVTK